MLRLATNKNALLPLKQGDLTKTKIANFLRGSFQINKETKYPDSSSTSIYAFPVSQWQIAVDSDLQWRDRPGLEPDSFMPQCKMLFTFDVIIITHEKQKIKTFFIIFFISAIFFCYHAHH